MVQNPYIWFRTRIYGMQPNIWYMAKYMVYGHMYGPKIAIYMDMAIPQNKVETHIMDRRHNWF